MCQYSDYSLSKWCPKLYPVMLLTKQGEFFSSLHSRVKNLWDSGWQELEEVCQCLGCSCGSAPDASGERLLFPSGGEGIGPGAAARGHRAPGWCSAPVRGAVQSPRPAASSGWRRAGSSERGTPGAGGGAAASPSSSSPPPFPSFSPSLCLLLPFPRAPSALSSRTTLVGKLWWGTLHRAGKMPVMKGLLAPQNTFLDTIATRFDGTREFEQG